MKRISYLVSLFFVLTLHSSFTNAENEKSNASATASSVAPGMAFAQASSSAVKGGSVNYSLEAEPPSLHPIMSADFYSEPIKALIFDSLLANDLNTYEWQPRLAEKWDISKDKKVFTYHLRKDLTFHDGHPLTAEDVKFSFDAIFEPRYRATHLTAYFDSIQKVEVVDPLTVKVTAKDTYFQNFLQFSTMYIIPKHIYGDVDNSLKMTHMAIGSGPYHLDKFEKGHRIVLQRFDKWYGMGTQEWKGHYNFDQLNYRFEKDQSAAIEMLKKGELDYLELTPENFRNKTGGDPWDKTIQKHQVENAMPKGYTFVGFNLRRDLFKDKNVRLALASMMNRELMNKKFRSDMSLLATGPNYIQSDYSSSSVKPILFDPKKAQELLAKAGWKDVAKKGVLQKKIHGKMQDFHFVILHSNKDVEKYLQMYKEDLKKIGVDLEIRMVEWNSYVKMIDDGDFDAMYMGWSGTVDWDPKEIWHSNSIGHGGSNFIAYENSSVDKLIDKARFELDRPKRMAMLHKVYELIAADVPYIFMFNNRYALYANSMRLTRTGDTMKYDIGRELWYLGPPAPAH